MKKRFRIFSLLAFSVLYSSLITVYNSNDFVDNVAFSLSIESENFSSLSPAIPPDHVEIAEGSITIVSNPPSSHKNQLYEVETCHETIEELFFSEFLTYSFYSQNFIIGLEKTDIIFPFHNFL